MNPLSAALQPLPLDELLKHYEQGHCLFVEGVPEKFEYLLTPNDIENRLNDGCNMAALPQLIQDGRRATVVESRCLWASASLRKSEFRKGLQEGHSFMWPNASQITPEIAALIDDIETVFESDSMHADVHLYVSTSAGGGSYQAHRDVPQHKILLQAYGETQWQLFDAKTDIPDSVIAVTAEEESKYLELASEFTLKQGDLLYMPSGTFHKVVGVTAPRISISIPFYAMPDAAKMDRSYIPFADLFGSA